MTAIADGLDVPAAFRADLGTIFISLELGKSTWLITSLAPGSDKMSRRTIAGGDVEGLFACFAQLRTKAHERQGKLYPLVVIQEAGLDGFWIDRVLSREAGSRVMLSMRRRSRCRAVTVAQRPIELMARC